MRYNIFNSLFIKHITNPISIAINQPEFSLGFFSFKGISNTFSCFYPVLYHNLMAALEGEPLQVFNPGGDYLLIFNMGDGKGVLKKKWLTFDGRLAFVIKDYIDRKFMKKFQAIE